MYQPDFDSLTRALGGTTSRREAVRILFGAAAGGVMASLGVGCSKNPVAPDLDECGVASACGARERCENNSGCICIRTPEGILRCGRIPSCSVRRCTTSADCADLGRGYFCDSPNTGCCSDTEQFCIAPCKEPPPTAFQLAAANNRGVLFSFNYLEHSTIYYGRKVGDRMDVSHVAFNGRNGNAAVVIVNEDFLPIQWIMPGATISLRRQDRTKPLDQRSALHFFATKEQETAKVDVSLGDMRQIIDSAEALLGQTFPNARNFLLTTTQNPNTLIARAKEPGNDQPRMIAAAIGMRAAAAVTKMAAVQHVAANGGARAIPALNVLVDAVQLSKMALAPLLGDILGGEFGPSRPENPNSPTINVMLCQGATRLPPICHYMFFLGGAFPCVDFCKVDLGCFSNICMPMSLGLQDADNVRGSI